MDFMDIISDLAGSITDFAGSNPLIAIVVALVLAFIIYRKPKLFFAILVVCAVIIGVMYVLSNLSTSGTAKKDRLIEKSVPDNLMRIPQPRI